MASKQAREAAKKYWQSVIDQQIEVAQEIIADGSYKDNPEKTKIFTQTVMALDHLKKFPKFIDSLKEDGKKKK